MTTITSRRAVLAGASALVLPVVAFGLPTDQPDAEIRAIGATQPASIEVAQAEDGVLLTLGEQIDPRLAAYRRALARHTEARALAEANCPQVPEELVCKGPQWSGCTEREQDVEGKDIWPPNYVGADGKTYSRAPRNFLNSAAMKAAIEQGNLYCDGRTKFGKRVRTLMRTAERYEAEREAAIEASGVRDAAHSLYLAAADIQAAAFEVRKFEPCTMTGVLIQARALSAHAEAELHAHDFEGRSGTVLGRELAAAVLRVTGGVRGAAA